MIACSLVPETRKKETIEFDEGTAIRLKLTDAAHRLVQSLTISVRIEIRPGKDSSLVLFQASKESRGLVGRIGALLLWWKRSSWIG